MTVFHRKLPRLQNFDYSANGAYFVTICTHNKHCLFGHVTTGDPQQDAQMHLSVLGKIVKTHILDLESHYENIKIDNWVIMPNHIHLLICIEERINPFPTVNIPNIVGKLKASITRSVRQNAIYSQPLWQKSYHDYIIRNEKDYLKIWQYITYNAEKWLEDCFYCE